MKKKDIRLGGLYRAKVSNKLTTVRVDSIYEAGFRKMTTHYGVTNLTTGRTASFRSAAKFRSEVVQS